MRRTISLIGTSLLANPRMAALASSRCRYPSYWIRSAAVSSSGSIRRSAGRAPDLPHGFAHRIEEGAAGVLHQMPPVCDLGCPRQRPGRRQSVAATAIACDDLDLRLVRKPVLGRRRLAIRQQGDCFAPLEIADDRPVTLVASPCPIVDANHGRWHETRSAMPSDDAEREATRPHLRLLETDDRCQVSLARWVPCRCRSDRVPARDRRSKSGPRPERLGSSPGSSTAACHRCTSVFLRLSRWRPHGMPITGGVSLATELEEDDRPDLPVVHLARTWSLDRDPAHDRSWHIGRTRAPTQCPLPRSDQHSVSGRHGRDSELCPMSKWAESCRPAYGRERGRADADVGEVLRQKATPSGTSSCCRLVPRTDSSVRTIIQPTLWEQAMPPRRCPDCSPRRAKKAARSLTPNK